MKSKPILIRSYGNVINTICNEENQIDKVIKQMSTDTCIFEGYEEWDEGDDMKWILTFRVLDDYELKPDLN